MELYAEIMDWKMPKNLGDEQYAEFMGWKVPGNVATCERRDDRSDAEPDLGQTTIV
jgi:hypothetical protein